MTFSTRDSDEVLSEINVTPLIDVMLVLLVMFIAAAPLLTNSIPINLPKTGSVASPEQRDLLVVSIDDADKLFISKDEIQPELLKSSLAMTKTKGTEARVQLQADEGADYGQVAKVIASIEHAGITRLAVVTVR